MAQSKEQLRRLRQKYHLGEYSQKRGKAAASRKTRRKTRGGFMARRKSGRKRRGGMGSLGGLIKPFAVGVIAGAFSDKLPVLNTLPPVVTGAAGGYLVKKSMMGAAAGAAGAYIGSPMLKNIIGSGGNSSAW